MTALKFYIPITKRRKKNLTHLEYMVEVERLGSITKLTSALYMGQPNLQKP